MTYGVSIYTAAMWGSTERRAATVAKYFIVWFEWQDNVKAVEIECRMLERDLHAALYIHKASTSAT
jgi:hypothetical protein